MINPASSTRHEIRFPFARMPRFARHRSRCLLPPLFCLALAAATPTVFPAPADRVPADNHPFLAGLAQAERKQDYHALLADCDRRIAARPDDREAYRRRALARWGAREYDGALADFGCAIDLARRQQAPARTLAVLAYGRALICREQHEPAAEAAELARAARADRSFTDPLNDLAWIRATNPDASLRDGRQAVALARQACATVPGSVKYLDTLAAAYAEAGDARQAADTEEAAIKAARADTRPDSRYKGFLATARERVDAYAKGVRYRDHPQTMEAASATTAASSR